MHTLLLAAIACPRSIEQRERVPQEERPDVYSYLDYRSFLRDYYDWGKANRNVSHRGLARRAHLKSPSYLKRVMDGTRNLSAQTAERVGAACMLKGKALEYFGDLVQFNQAKTSDQRRAAYARIRGFERYRRVRQLDIALDDYFAHWYVPVIRELAASPRFNPDPSWVAKAVRPRIKLSEAKAALRVLEKLGLLIRDDDGRVRPADKLVSTGGQTASVQMGHFHRAMIGRGMAAIDEIAAAERDISSLTFCVDATGLERLKQRIQVFRRELLVDDTISEGIPQQVVQVNFQVFPLSRVLEDESQ